MYPSGFCFRVSCSCSSEPRAVVLTARGELLWRLHLCTAIRRARRPFGRSVPTRTRSPAERGLYGFTGTSLLLGSREGWATRRFGDLPPLGHVTLVPSVSARTPSLPCPLLAPIRSSCFRGSILAAAGPEATATRSVAGGSCTLLVSVPNSVSPLLLRSCLPVCDLVCSLAFSSPIGPGPSPSNLCTTPTVLFLSTVFFPAGFCSPAAFFLL